MSNNTSPLTNIPYSEYILAKHKMLQKASIQLKNPIFPGIPGDIRKLIFSFFNIHAYTKCCLISRSWNKYITKEAYDIFRLASICLGLNEPNGSKSSQKSNFYLIYLNERISFLRFSAKIADAFVCTKGLSLSHITSQKLTDNNTLNNILYSGLEAHLILSRFELSSWEKINHCADHLLPQLETYNLAFLHKKLQEYLIQNLFDNALEMFENTVLQFYPSEVLKFGKEIISNLCKKTEYTKAIDFFDKHLKDDDSVDAKYTNDIISIMIENAVTNDQYDAIEKCILSWSEDNDIVIKLSELINRCKKTNHAKSTEIVKNNRDVISKRLIDNLCEIHFIHSPKMKELDIILPSLPSTSYCFLEVLCLTSISNPDRLNTITEKLLILNKCDIVKKLLELFIKHYTSAPLVISIDVSKKIIDYLWDGNQNTKSVDFFENRFNEEENRSIHFLVYFLNKICDWIEVRKDFHSISKRLVTICKNDNKKANNAIREIIKLKTDSNKTWKERLIKKIIFGCDNLEKKTLYALNDFFFFPIEFTEVITCCNHISFELIFPLLREKAREYPFRSILYTKVIDRCESISTHGLYEAFKADLDEDNILKIIGKLDVYSNIHDSNCTMILDAEKTLKTLAKSRSKNILVALKRKYKSVNKKSQVRGHA